MKRIIPLILFSGCVAAIIALTLNKENTSRESLMPVLRAVQAHTQQADRAAGKIIPLGKEDELRLGAELSANFRPLVVSTGAAYLLVQGRLLPVAARLEAQDRAAKFRGDYKFSMIDADYQNAFAIPGARVYITKGLMKLFYDVPGTGPRVPLSDDMLASVLGHEIGHIELGHCANMFRTREWLRKIGFGKAADAALFFRALAQMQFSRTQELEADAFGFEIMRAAGFNPAAAPMALETIGGPGAGTAGGRRNPGELLGEAILDYFHTHPGGPERVNALKGLLARHKHEKR